jgi:hypothetical protein
MTISHAIVLPDRDFDDWLEVVRPYMRAFERVAVIRGPAGNDLNRFRNITAVQAPLTWHNDDALAHIRRAYPMVVMVDVIEANTPTELQTEMQIRINTDDRYGEKRSTPQHIFERFVIDWPSSARPASITRRFSSSNDRHIGIDISAYRDALVSAGTPGSVNRVVRDDTAFGSYVQIMSAHNGQTYIITYAGLDDIDVSPGDSVVTGDAIGRAAGDAVKIIVQNPPGGLGGFQWPNIVDPTPLIYFEGIRVRPTVGILRVRSLPGTNGDILGTVTSSDLLETREMHGRTLAKLGVDGQWLHIRRAGMNAAYVAAWFLEGYSLYDPPEAIPGVAIPGMNIDPDFRIGLPAPDAIKALGWVRLTFNVSLNPNIPEGDPNRYGNTDVDFAFNRYRPILQQYANAGIKIILVLTHQTYGEGQGFVWPQMDSGRWRELTEGYAQIVQATAARFRNTGLVYAYQIWNEQDTLPENARAAVPIPAEDYGNLLSETIQAIRSVDRDTTIITGGHITGPDPGTTYIQNAFRAMPGSVRPDGIAFHPYGRGPVGNRFSNNGSLSYAIRQWSRVLPGKPLWITEWGVLNIQGDDSLAEEVTEYANGFVNIIETEFPGQVAAACWFAWADGMDNGYGMVKANNQPRQPLFTEYLRE